MDHRVNLLEFKMGSFPNGVKDNLEFIIGIMTKFYHFISIHIEQLRETFANYNGM